MYISFSNYQQQPSLKTSLAISFTLNLEKHEVTAQFNLSPEMLSAVIQKAQETGLPNVVEAVQRIVLGSHRRVITGTLESVLTRLVSDFNLPLSDLAVITNYFRNLRKTLQIGKFLLE